MAISIAKRRTGNQSAKYRRSSLVRLGLVALFTIIMVVALDSSVSALLWNPISVVFVLGGTLLASLMSHQNSNLKQIYHSLIDFITIEPRSADTIEAFLAAAQKIKSDQIREVEKELKHLRIPFLKIGLQLVLDNKSSEDIMKVLSLRIARARAFGEREHAVFHSMADYAPAFGMLGTLLGLLGMLSNMGDGDIGRIGQQMAMALVTTFYGIILANLFFRPVAVHLEKKVEHRIAVMKNLAEAIVLINSGYSTSQIKTIYTDALAHEVDELIDERA